MNWTLVFTAQAKKDAKRLASAGLKDQAQRLLDVLAQIPTRRRRVMRSWLAIWPGRIPDESISNIVSCIRCWRMPG
ncbi:MAG: hypothetical protein WBL72_02400 [Thermoguttaceae bacterium]